MLKVCDSGLVTAMTVKICYDDVNYLAMPRTFVSTELMFPLLKTGFIIS